MGDRVWFATAEQRDPLVWYPAGFSGFQFPFQPAEDFSPARLTFPGTEVWAPVSVDDEATPYLLVPREQAMIWAWRVRAWHVIGEVTAIVEDEDEVEHEFPFSFDFTFRDSTDGIEIEDGIQVFGTELTTENEKINASGSGQRPWYFSASSSTENLYVYADIFTSTRLWVNYPSTPRTRRSPVSSPMRFAVDGSIYIAATFGFDFTIEDDAVGSVEGTVISPLFPDGLEASDFTNDVDLKIDGMQLPVNVSANAPTRFTGTITVDPAEYWPYANSNGDPIYNTTTGERLRNPLG
jgi:uncharacterized protein YdeI (BOF family)